MKTTVGLFMCCLFVATTFAAGAQERELSGIVTGSSKGKPLAGVTVMVKGRASGTPTDDKGAYSLAVKSSDVLMFSFVGMESREIPVNDLKKLDIVLKPEGYFMDEVLVIAYGTMNKASFTGSASNVEGDKVFRDLPITSFEQALQGAMPGLTVSPTSGQPGAALNLRIRGTGSMNASQEPLYVIDGIPVISGNIAVTSAKNDPKTFNIFTTLNPSDIESITILKDAAAASLYGSRAANGVIVITTKRGLDGKTRFNLKANWGVSDWATKNRETLSGDQQHELTYEAFYNEAVGDGKDEVAAAAYAQKNADKFAPKLAEYSDWEKALFNKHGVNQNYEFSAQGGGKKSSFYASLGYRKEEGMTKFSVLEGFTGKVNLAHEVSEKIRMGANIALAKQHSDLVPENGYINPYYATRSLYRPNYPIYNEDGSFREDYLSGAKTLNLVKEQGLDKNTSDVFRSLNTIWASFEIWGGLSFKQTLSYDFVLNESGTYWPAGSSNGKVHNGVMAKIVQQTHNLYSSSLLSYTKTFRLPHHLDLLVGWDVDDRNKKYLQATGKNYPNDKLPEMENSTIPNLAASGYTDDNLLAFLSRASYDYDGKYYFSANFRRDGSSRLGINNRWGNFWSLSTAWCLSRENFMKSAEFVDNLKLRMSYGVNGTLPSDLYGHLSSFRYGTNSYMEEPGIALAALANVGLSWEKNCNFNLGIDAHLWNRVSLVLDFYNRETKDLLQRVPVSMVVGFPTVLDNVGAMNNRGVEMDLNVQVLKDLQVKWTTGLVLSHNRNKITKLYGDEDIVDGSRILKVGESYYSFWSREWAGVDPETGEEMWILNTENPDGTVNRGITKNPDLAARTVVGKADPALTGGWRNRVEWKGFELSALFSFSVGGKFMDDLWTLAESDGYVAYHTIGVKQYDRWKKPGDVTDVPKRINAYGYGRHGSSRHLFSTDHIRLKNISLSYSVPTAVLDKIGLHSLRVFASGSNLLTWAAYDDLDPEQPVDGFPTWAFPMMKSCTFGVEIGF